MTIELHVDQLDWTDHAQCNGTNPDLFFPARGRSADTKAAKAICAQCTVVTECLAFATENRILYGVWGGTSEYERRQLRIRRRSSIPDAPKRGPLPGTVQHPINHGTNGGFNTHLRRGEEPCDRCRNAHAKYKQHTRSSRAGS